MHEVRTICVRSCASRPVFFYGYTGRPANNRPAVSGAAASWLESHGCGCETPPCRRGALRVCRAGRRLLNARSKCRLTTRFIWARARRSWITARSRFSTCPRSLALPSTTRTSPAPTKRSLSNCPKTSRCKSSWRTTPRAVSWVRRKSSICPPMLRASCFAPARCESLV